jgi:hypothetical protein
VRQKALPSFVEERARFGLRFTCEYCTYFHVERERCMHGYPNAEHREAHQGQAAELVFCKEFELM